MKGYLLYYKDLNSYQIVKMNNILFGRVVKIRRKNKTFYYYYSGVCDSIKYYKFINGIYFFPEKNISTEFISSSDGLSFFKADVDISEDKLYTAKEYFKDKHKTRTVINLE